MSVAVGIGCHGLWLIHLELDIEVQSFINKIEFRSNLEKCVTTNPNVHSWCFFLRVCGMLAPYLAQETPTANAMLTFYVEVIRERCWSNPSVEYAFLESMSQMCTHKVSFMTVLSRDFISTIESLLSSGSVYVCNKAVDVIVLVITHTFDNNGGIITGDITMKYVVNLCDELPCLDAKNIKQRLKIAQKILESREGVVNIMQSRSLVSYLSNAFVKDILLVQSVVPLLSACYKALKAVETEPSNFRILQPAQSANPLGDGVLTHSKTPLNGSDVQQDDGGTGIGALECRIRSSELLTAVRGMALAVAGKGHIKEALVLAGWCLQRDPEKKIGLCVLLSPLYALDCLSELSTKCGCCTLTGAAQSNLDEIYERVSVMKTERRPLFIKCLVVTVNHLIYCGDDSQIFCLLTSLIKGTQIKGDTVDRIQMILGSKHTLTHAALDACVTILEKGADREYEGVVELVNACVAFLKPSPGVVYKMQTPEKSIKCMLSCTKHIQRHTPAQLHEIFNDTLFQAVLKRICDLSWEIRDTILGFIQQLCVDFQGVSVVEDWLTKHRLHTYILSALGDSESYVRSSAVNVLHKYCQNDTVWNAMVNDTAMIMNMDQIIQRLSQIIQNDGVAFPRRAAVNMLITCLSRDKSCDASINKSMRDAILDCDWEVKLNSLKYWESIVAETLKPVEAVPSYAVGLDIPEPTPCSITDILRTFVHNGTAGALICAFHDEDKPVNAKCCEILKRIHKFISDNELQKIKIDMNCEEDKPSVADRGDASSNSHEQTTNVNVQTFVSFLLETDIHETSDIVSSSIDHHCDNITSMLEDMIGSMKEQPAPRHLEDDDVKAADIDCY